MGPNRPHAVFREYANILNVVSHGLYEVDRKEMFRTKYLTTQLLVSSKMPSSHKRNTLVAEAGFSYSGRRRIEETSQRQRLQRATQGSTTITNRMLTG